MSGVAFPASATCWGCGRTVGYRSGKQKRHACRLRLLSRAKWAAHQAGWHSGYRFAIENRDDELVLADFDDYGTGWAGHMWAGGITIVGGGE